MSTAPLTPPMPALEPLQLLYVTNGSPLTADRWWQAHHYYQHRQNLHYQSLHQPGIVCGLGVRVIPAPTSMPAELRDHRWIEIQPGIAIDLVGNPIVVDEPVTFRITSEVIEAPITIYVVLAYVNPRAKQWSGIPADIVKEEFRINERTTPPAPDEVELCRIQLTHNRTPLQNAGQVMHPASHELDLRQRQQVRVRSQQPVQVGLVHQPPDSPYRDRLTALLQAIDGLYPPLSGSVNVTDVMLNRSTTPGSRPSRTATNIGAFTILFLSYDTAIALTDSEIEHLQQYMAQGSTLLIEYTDEQPGNTPSLIELQAVQEELLSALADLQDVEAGTELDRMSQELTDELLACETAFQNQLQAIAHPIQQFAQTPNDEAETPPSHQSSSMLTNQPFLFDELPHLPTGPIRLLAWEGIVLVVGSLTAAWARQQFEQPLPRSTLRSAQELGINLLYHASRRQQLVRAQQLPL
ncbi:MAG: hypothetical protein AAGE59_18700 [Cyanobacteria bacterium P01_F01_bin.86]